MVNSGPIVSPPSTRVLAGRPASVAPFEELSRISYPKVRIPRAAASSRGVRVTDGLPSPAGGDILLIGTNREARPDVHQAEDFPGDGESIACLLPPPVSVEWIRLGIPHDGSRNAAHHRTPCGPHSSAMRLRRNEDDAVAPSAGELSSYDLDLLSRITSSWRQRTDVARQYAQALEDEAVRRLIPEIHVEPQSGEDRLLRGIR